MHLSSIPFARAEALALDLPSDKDRVLAIKWLGKLKELQSGEQNEPGELSKLVDHITTMFLECLDRNFLIGPFKMMPPDRVPSREEWEKYQPGDMVALIRQQQKAEQGDSGERPVTTHVSPNIRQYLVYQEVPNFGMQFYYAFSSEPITDWANADLAYLEDGTPFLESEKSQDTSLLERSRYIEAEEKAKKARKAEPRTLPILPGDSPETIKFKKLPPHLRQRHLQREAEKVATKDLNLTPVAFRPMSKPPYTQSYEPEMFGLTPDEQFEGAETYFKDVEWTPEGRQIRPREEDEDQRPVHPYLGVPPPDLKKYEDYEKFEREMEERQMLLYPRPQWLSPRKRAHFERIQTIQSQGPPTLNLSTISVDIEPEEYTFTRIEWDFDDAMPKKAEPSLLDLPITSVQRPPLRAIGAQSSSESSSDDALTVLEMETDDIFAEDQIASPEAPRFVPEPPPQLDIQKILKSIRRSHGLDDDQLDSIEAEILNNSVVKAADPEVILEKTMQDLMPSTSRRAEQRRQTPEPVTPMRDRGPEEKRKMVQERLAALKPKPKVVEGVLVELSPEAMAQKNMTMTAEEFTVSPRKYVQTVHARRQTVDDEDPDLLENITVTTGQYSTHTQRRTVDDEDLEAMEEPSFEDYGDVSLSDAGADPDQLERSVYLTSSSSSEQFEDLQLKIPEPVSLVEDYDIAPIITAEQMAAEAQRYQSIKKRFVRQKFEPIKLKLDYQLLEDYIEEAVEMLQDDLLDPEISEMFTDALTILDKSIEEIVADEPMLSPPPASPKADEIIGNFENQLNEIYKVRELRYVPELTEDEMLMPDFEEDAAAAEAEMQKWKRVPAVRISAPSPSPRSKQRHQEQRADLRHKIAKQLFTDDYKETPIPARQKGTGRRETATTKKTTETLVTVDEPSPEALPFVPKDDGLTPHMRLKKLLDQIQDEGLLKSDAILQDEEIKLYDDEADDGQQSPEGLIRVEVTTSKQSVYEQLPQGSFDWLGPQASPPRTRKAPPQAGAPKKPSRQPGTGPSLRTGPSGRRLPSVQVSAPKTPAPRPRTSSRLEALAAPKSRSTVTTKVSSRLESLAAPKVRDGPPTTKVTTTKLTRSKSTLNRSGRG